MKRDRGFQYERTEHSALEKAFADLWEFENRPRPGVNFGHGILQDLFMERQSGFMVRCEDMMSKKERYVAATVVQWLGTNCGMAFLAAALRKDGLKIVDAKDSEIEPMPVSEKEMAEYFGKPSRRFKL